MKPAPFDYRRAGSVTEAIDLLGSADGEAKIMAGGQSLTPMLNLRMAAPELIVDVSGAPELRTFEASDRAIRYGACLTHEMIQTGAVPDPSNGLMPRVASRISYQAVRTRGTIGGSLALADPAADWVTTMAALGAVIEWRGPGGAQDWPADDFVLAAYTTRLGPADVLTAIRIPRLSAEARWGTYKLCRKTGEYAHAMATVVRDGGRARAVLGATGGGPLRLAETEQVLARMSRFDRDAERALAECFTADIAAATVTMDEVKAWQSRACLLRAAAMSFGVEAPKIGAA